MTPPARTEEARRTAGILAVATTTVIWGLAPLVLKQVTMPTLTFAAYRLWMGVLVFAAVFVVTGRRLRWATLRTCALGGVIFTADVACSFLAFRLTSVADATIIGALAPVCIMIGAAKWFGERVERRDMVFVGLSLVGVSVVAIGSAGAPSFSGWGELFAVASVFTWTAYWLFSKQARSGVGALEYIDERHAGRRDPDDDRRARLGRRAGAAADGDGLGLDLDHHARRRRDRPRLARVVASSRRGVARFVDHAMHAGGELRRGLGAAGGDAHAA